MKLFRQSSFRVALLHVLGGIALMMGSVSAEAGQAYLVLDGKSGRVMASDNADTLNHPASLTKMMTLYMTFEALHKGRLSWDSKIRITRNAASKIPTKLGVRAGTSITVREAVYGMIVLSANDAAAAMGDELGGSELEFAGMMTKRAKRLGMRRTVFYNASGLPHSRQFTTARDMSTLAIALQRDYPREYKLFAMKSFKFRGRTIRGHNNLMYRYEGMDGIKTGYVDASGFNIVSSVRHGNRRLVGVVLGGKTARSRDAKMAALLDKYMPDATTGRSEKLIAATRDEKNISIADASQIPVPRVAPRDNAELEVASVESDIMPPVAVETTNTRTEIRTDGDWAVQIAATDTKASAVKLLDRARRKAGTALTPYTEAVGKGKSRLYRARFVNFGDRQEANAACEILKRKAFSCLVLSTR